MKQPKLFEQPQVVQCKDILIHWKDGSLPGIENKELLRHFYNTRVSTVFVTEDDMYDSKVVEEKVSCFINQYGMQACKVKVIVMIATNPTSRHAGGFKFPFQVRISVFPLREYKLFDNG